MAKKKKEEEPKVTKEPELVEEVPQQPKLSKEELAKQDWDSLHAKPVFAESREKRWEKLLEDYQKQNPEKYDDKLKKGCFKTIPESFQ